MDVPPDQYELFPELAEEANRTGRWSLLAAVCVLLVVLGLAFFAGRALAEEMAGPPEVNKTDGQVGELVEADSTLERKMREHLEWIAVHTKFRENFKADAPLPRVEYLSKDIMQVRAYGPDAVAKADFEGYYIEEVLAMYKGGVIYLNTGYDPEDPMTEHYLVHELVHHLQWLEDPEKVEKTCAGKMEPMAYRLHEMWQYDHNSPADRPNWLSVMLGEQECDGGRYH